MSHNDPRYDVRIRERRLRDGKLTQEEYDAFLAELPDEAENAVECEAKMSHSGAEAEA